jgi:hypothetical protein
MDRKTEAENALIYQIRSAAQRVRESIGAEELSRNRRELNQLGADLAEIRKQNRKKQ